MSHLSGKIEPSFRSESHLWEPLLPQIYPSKRASFPLLKGKCEYTAPQGLDQLEQRVLIRAVEREAAPRDIALITLMVNTGLRISEVAALDVEDLTLGDRLGSLKVRQGKGGKYRTVT